MPSRTVPPLVRDYARLRVTTLHTLVTELVLLYDIKDGELTWRVIDEEMKALRTLIKMQSSSSTGYEFQDLGEGFREMWAFLQHGANILLSLYGPQQAG